jgi:hypothetical protein
VGIFGSFFDLPRSRENSPLPQRDREVKRKRRAAKTDSFGYWVNWKRII